MNVSEPFASMSRSLVDPGGSGLALSDPTYRRDADRTLHYWGEGHTEEAVHSVDLTKTLPDDWSHCFVVLAEPEIERSVFLTYGRDFARLLGLPVDAVPSLPLTGQLSPRLAEVFLRGCIDARQHEGPVRAEGHFERDDQQRELYRAVFIPIAGRETGPRIFGSYNSRLLEPQSDDLPPPPVSFWQSIKRLFRL